jgi:hypothetical protein
VADVEHGERLINTNDPTTLEALRHRPSHSTGTRRHVENLLVALQNEHFRQFFGEIGADPRGAAIKLCRVLGIMEMSFVPVAVAMPMFVIVLVVMVMPVNVLVIVCVLMPVFVVMFVTVPVLVNMLLAVLVMLMFVTVIVLMFVFVFFAHGFAIPSLKFD